MNTWARYEEMIRNTSTRAARPWYVVPADHKVVHAGRLWRKRSSHVLDKLNLSFPKVGRGEENAKT